MRTWEYVYAIPHLSVLLNVESYIFKFVFLCLLDKFTLSTLLSLFVFLVVYHNSYHC